MKPLVSVIVLSYNSRRYIEKCLDTLLAQDYPELEILIVINGSSDGSREAIKQKYGRHKKIRLLEPPENLWYSRGNNWGIRKSRGQYILALNQDTVLSPSFISTLVRQLEAEPSLGSVSGKLLHYKFDIDSKTRILDSTGIEMFRTRRVIDRGQWEVDRGQYDRDLEIFGASGAAALYRRQALEECKLPKADGSQEYFDESFVAYKEDVDLSWRLQLAGWRCRYVPEAVIYHGRMVGRSWPTQFIRFILNRRRQPRKVRKLSFRNHYLMMVKNEVSSVFWLHFPLIFFREILLLLYSVLFEQFQIFSLGEFFRLLPEAVRKRKLVMRQRTISTAEVRRLFD